MPTSKKQLEQAPVLFVITILCTLGLALSVTLCALIALGLYVAAVLDISITQHRTLPSRLVAD